MVKGSDSNNGDDTLSSLDEAIREFHSIRENLQWVSPADKWPLRAEESTGEVAEELLPVAAR